MVKHSFHVVEVDGGYGEHVNKWIINRRRVMLDILWIPDASTQYLTAEMIYSEWIFERTFLNIKAIYKKLISRIINNYSPKCR